jgi:hypothetical protein
VVQDVFNNSQHFKNANDNMKADPQMKYLSNGIFGSATQDGSFGNKWQFFSQNKRKGSEDNRRQGTSPDVMEFDNER